MPRVYNNEKKARAAEKRAVKRIEKICEIEGLEIGMWHYERRPALTIQNNEIEPHIEELICNIHIEVPMDSIPGAWAVHFVRREKSIFAVGRRVCFPPVIIITLSHMFVDLPNIFNNEGNS